MEVKYQLGDCDSDASTVLNPDLPQNRMEEFEDSQHSVTATDVASDLSQVAPTSAETDLDSTIEYSNGGIQ